MKERWSKFIMGLLFVLPLASTAAAETTVKELLSEYDNADKTFREFIEYNVLGYAGGMGWINTFLQDENQQVYCQPGKLALTGPLVIEMLRDGVKETPELANWPFGMAILCRLRVAFPCSDGVAANNCLAR